MVQRSGHQQRSRPTAYSRHAQLHPHPTIVKWSTPSATKSLKRCLHFHREPEKSIQVVVRSSACLIGPLCEVATKIPPIQPSHWPKPLRDIRCRWPRIGPISRRRFRFLRCGPLAQHAHCVWSSRLSRSRWGVREPVQVRFPLGRRRRHARTPGPAGVAPNPTPRVHPGLEADPPRALSAALPALPPYLPNLPFRPPFRPRYRVKRRVEHKCVRFGP